MGLSLPHGLRYLLAWDHGLCRAVLAVYTRTLLGWQRRRARQRGVHDGRSGSVTVVQRFGGALNLNVHFHTLLVDGVFTVNTSDGDVRFHRTSAPTDVEVARVLTTIRSRILRLLARRGLGRDADESGADALAGDSPVLAGLSRASVQWRIALGPRAGARLIALGRDPDAQWGVSGGPRHAHVDGFDLHGNVAVDGMDRERLEGLCRYVLRPAVAEDRLRLDEDGRVVLELETAWADGTSHVVFEPLDLMARLAALTPRSRINLIFYHGVLAPNARYRGAIVAYEPASAIGPPPLPHTDLAPEVPLEPGADTRSRGRNWTWAQLMARAFAIDVLACRRCGDRLRLIATIFDPRVVSAVLRSVGLPTETVDRPPPRRVSRLTSTAPL